jgi:cephalosporin hydroxylase
MEAFKRGLEILREEGVIVFTKKAARYLLYLFFDYIIGNLFKSLIIKKFKSFINTINDFYDAIDYAFSFRFLGISIKPLQVKYEITRLLEIVSQLKPKVVLEIGTAGGGTLFLFTRVADPEAKIISVDLPSGYPKWKMHLYKSFSRMNQKIYLIRGNSHDPQTFEKVKIIIGDEWVDFLFIDGDHSYEGVKKDFEMYSKLVRKGGIVAFHDIVLYPPSAKIEVSRFWNEIKHHYKYEEIVKDWNQNWGGIGILYI